MSNKPIIFFDRDCRFCLWCVGKILRWDCRECFLFAPLRGETAARLFTGKHAKLKGVNALILWESKHSSWIKAKALFRIFYLMNRGWTILGLLHWIPGFFMNPVYSLVAKNRHLLKFVRPDYKRIQKNSWRFLP